jgi:hypothetical protein
MQSARVAAAVQRLKQAFDQHSDVRLTLEEAVRLSGLEEPQCVAVLRALEDAHVVREQDGRYVREAPEPETTDADPKPHRRTT